MLYMLAYFEPYWYIRVSHERFIIELRCTQLRIHDILSYIPSDFINKGGM